VNKPHPEILKRGCQKKYAVLSPEMHLIIHLLVSSLCPSGINHSFVPDILQMLSSVDRPVISERTPTSLVGSKVD
jgi:hypothetical protein